MTTEKNAEKCLIFVCKLCDFKCCKESNYKKHLDTNKHNRLHETTKKMPIIETKNFICICGKKYFHHTSLAKHKRTCVIEKTHTSSSIVTKDNSDTNDGFILENEINKKIDSTNDKELKELVKELIKQNGELVKTINDIVPKIGNTNITNNNNNNFNLNVFLNEQCKDALNISDFINSLKITLEDLLFSKTNGISRGITDVMIKGLKELDIHKRPIHCTDIKRDIMYIKNEDNWSKDDNHEIMKNTIVKIADKERTALQQWAIDNPDWIETERKQLEYLTMMRSICEPIENYNNYEKKIIKILSKEIQVDKKVNNE
jgi:ferritin